jgi:aspartate carbamoyltransferase catalytic subunit
MTFKGQSIISIRDMEKEALLKIIETADAVKRGGHKGCLKGKVVSTAFFEPSTRTRFSFASATQYMGGQVIGFAGTASTSVTKGESLVDTIKTISGYCDVIVIRHPVEGAARLASEAAIVPVINAGDGANQHPTQTFLDLFTMSERFRDLSEVRVGFLGDLKYGRTVHSLAYALALFRAPMVFIAPEILSMPGYLLEEIREMGSETRQFEALCDIDIPLDVLYVTRIQKERFGDMQEYERVAGTYRVTPETVRALSEGVRIMHPLPRVDEIDVEVDAMENAIYFEQAHNGIPVRQAILGLVTGSIS